MTDSCLRIVFELARAAQRRQLLQQNRARRRPAPRRITPPRLSPAQQIGAEHETRATQLLIAQGLIPLARNLRCRAGEIDLVMRDSRVLVFVEVRARAASAQGNAAASICRAKQLRLTRAAAYWLPSLARKHWPGQTPAARFDVVTFESGRPCWLRAAFWLD